eukprot:TRINITY_DN78844_c0_g1_i1.p1 TRINITY_DN78844_c0_g1~~TRINITY_DN78844_c0_g1_i1.p1  ORF type:complete len:348 (-),score=80.77 TRINITY_DN78844_c0_g1_i1:118-1161(-)
MEVHSVEERSLEDFHSLRCNWHGKDGQGCTKSNAEDFWMTSCGHIFCFDHAKAVFGGSDTCPVCHFVGARVVQTNLSRESRFRKKRGLLVGLAPSEIMETVDGAINFWIRQKALEASQRAQRCGILEQREKSIRESIEVQISERQKECHELEMEQTELQQKIDATEVEQSKVSAQLQRLKREHMDAEEQYRSLRAQVYGKPQRAEWQGTPHAHMGGTPLKKARLERGPPKMSESTAFQRASAFSFQSGTPSRDQRNLTFPSSAFRGPVKSDQDAREGLLGERPGAFQNADTPAAFRSAARLGAAPGFVQASGPDLFGGGPSSGLRRSMASLTPGFLGAGRLTKRRIT